MRNCCGEISWALEVYRGVAAEKPISWNFPRASSLLLKLSHVHIFEMPVINQK